MGVNTYTHETTTPVAPTRLFKALVLDSDNLVPKLMPQVVKNIEIVEGDGGAGSIKKMNFVEGDVLGDKLESIFYDIKFEASGNGGCVCKSITEYYTKDDYVLKEEEHNEDKNQGIELFTTVEAYLLANVRT
ncbi:hypothetical protein RND71_022567 [Anisodus tanguticus]|uniref:Bet v I/Major latex protein domain-containing protein n=1 Tax=Anisodus tanguticus TaxID=243964 RepID=A0AAE1RTY5_9SOLA|nr:hypothetical protein RND71_022567 [Anisodus tanguticus]